MKNKFLVYHWYKVLESVSLIASRIGSRLIQFGSALREKTSLVLNSIEHAGDEWKEVIDDHLEPKEPKAGEGGQALVLVAILIAVAAVIAFAAFSPILTDTWNRINAQEVSLGRAQVHGDKHGEDYQKALDCLNDESNTMQSYYNKNTHRFGFACFKDGMFYVVIARLTGEVVTAFLKDPTRYQTWEQITHYFETVGYKP